MKDPRLFVLFCNSRYGWGQDKFFEEANEGVGMKFPKSAILRFYFKWVLPLIVFVIFVLGYVQKFAPSVYNKIFG